MPETYKVLGQAIGTGSNVDLYTVGGGLQAVVYVTITNRGPTARTASVFVRPNGASVTTAHHIATDITILGNDATKLDIPITVNDGDIITVVGHSDLTFMAMGSEEPEPA